MGAKHANQYSDKREDETIKEYQRRKAEEEYQHSIAVTKAMRWVSEKWTSRNDLGDNYVLGGIHYETSTPAVHCRVQKERRQPCC